MFPRAGEKWTWEKPGDSFSTPFCFIFGLTTDILYRTRVQSDNHIGVNDQPTLKLLEGELLSTTMSLLAASKKSHQSATLNPPHPPQPLVHAQVWGAFVTVWPSHCPEETPKVQSSPRQMLYSYEIFLVLSAIYFTYTVLKQRTSFLLAPPPPNCKVCNVHIGKSEKANETSSFKNKKRRKEKKILCTFFSFHHSLRFLTVRLKPSACIKLHYETGDIL